jgi:hypothetical protein
VSGALYWFLGTATAAVGSAYLWVLAWREGNRRLMWVNGVGVVVFCGAALFFGSQL